MTKAPKWRMRTLDKPTPLVWVDTAMPCRRCKQPSHWRTPLSRVNGVHPWCDWTPFERLADEAFIDVLYGLAQVFQAVIIPVINEPARPQYIRNGPCSWCGRPGIGISADAYLHCSTHMWPPFRWPETRGVAA